MTKAASFRDFIYLDIERVRSFSAQLLEGLPSELSVTLENQAGVEGTAKGGFPGFAQAEANANYSRSRADLELKLIHDRLFTRFVDKLSEEKLMKDASEIAGNFW